MCGRFRLARKKEILEESFEIDEAFDDLDWTPRYNVAPGQTIAVIRQQAAAHENARPVRRLCHMRWGLIPHWAKQAALGNKMINARAETVAAKPAFAEALRFRRCLVPADGCYEWKREGRHKQPYCFTLADNALFGFAALWDSWLPPQQAKQELAGDRRAEAIESCTILTTDANPLLREIHDRMPVILPREAYELWLDPKVTDVNRLLPFLKPYPAAQMRGYRVSPRVNHVIYDDAACAAEVEAPATLFANPSLLSE